MKKKNGFTLVELLAVIVILAVILVIAVPKITTTIESLRGSSIEASAKMILDSAEQRFAAKLILDDTYNPGTMDCTDVADINTNDYDISTCKVTFTSNVASISLTGKGKFKDYVCTGTKDELSCTKGGGYIELDVDFWPDVYEYADEYLSEYGLEIKKMEIKIPKKYENLSLKELVTSNLSDISCSYNENEKMDFCEFDIKNDSTLKVEIGYYEDKSYTGMFIIIGNYNFPFGMIETVKDYEEFSDLDDGDYALYELTDKPIKELGKLYLFAGL